MTARAVFIGMPGSGKTTVGKQVAKALGVPFADTDWLIEEKAGKSVGDIFSQDGEDAFRTIEADVIAEALEDYDGVLSLGGGAVVTERTRELLKKYPVFLIDVTDDFLVRRITRSVTDRPLMRENPRDQVLRLRKERDAFYRECATYTLHSDGRPSRRVAREALGILGQLSSTIISAPGGDFDVIIGHHLDRDIQLAVERHGTIALISESTDEGSSGSGHRIRPRRELPRRQ